MKGKGEEGKRRGDGMGGKGKGGEAPQFTFLSTPLVAPPFGDTFVNFNEHVTALDS